MKKYGIRIYFVIPQNFTSVLKLLGLKISSRMMNKVKKRISVTDKNGKTHKIEQILLLK